MSCFGRLTVWKRMLETGLTPLFYHSKPSMARHVAAACSQGGAELLEFTDRGDRAAAVFQDLVPFVRKEIPSMAVGVGSITDPQAAALYMSHGADFIVCPTLEPEVMKLCNRRGVACVPGCGTPTEVRRARELGAEIIKIFPARALGGPSFIKSLKGPMPDVKLMPTGGVRASREDIADWLDAGADCLGMGSALVPDDALQQGDVDVVEENVRQALHHICEVRTN